MRKERNKSTAAVSAPPRRNFLNLLWAGLGLAALAELFCLVGIFLRSSRVKTTGRAEGSLLAAGAVNAFPKSSVTAFPRGRFYLARLEDGGFLALSRRCPHLGCTLPWIEAEQRFVCPCHASVFDMRGDVLRSPAPRAMALHPVVIENDIVLVDISNNVQRDRFENTQAVYPKKI